MSPTTTTPVQPSITNPTQPAGTVTKKPALQRGRKRAHALKQGRPKVKRPIGPPTVLTDKIRGTLTRLVREGNYLEVAAAYAGIHRTTLFDWLRWGRKYLEALATGKPPEEKHAIYGELVDSVDRAMASSELRDTRRIDKAATEDWKAAAYRQERRFPERWAIQSKIDQVAEQKSQEHLREMLERLQHALPPDQYRAACEALALPVDALETKSK